MINGNQHVYTNCVIDICSFTHFNDLILSVFFFFNIHVCCTLYFDHIGFTFVK